MKRRRRIVQAGFLALTLVGVFVVGANAERWCPFGGVEALFTYFHDGDLVCSLGISNFYMLGGVVLMTLLVRRAFCGYVCPIGAISEGIHAVGRRLRLPALRVPASVDRGLALLKYAVLGLVLYATWRTGELMFRGYDPCYALISRHGEDIRIWAYVISGAIVLASLILIVPFCRWFCPLAAVLNPLSRFGVARVRRDAAACRDCGACARACPVAVPVDRVGEVTAARCLSCLSCIEACPARSRGALAWGAPARWGQRWPQAALVLVVLACIGGAVAAAYAFPLPSFVKTRNVPPPAQTAAVDLRIENLACRGRANLLFYFLERDDMYQVPGYLKFEAWPGPGFAAARVTYDPARTDEESIKRAITEDYFEIKDDHWRPSEFRIEGYDPLGLGSP